MKPNILFSLILISAATFLTCLTQADPVVTNSDSIGEAELMPLVSFDGVPLLDAVRVLAMQAALNIVFDPRLLNQTDAQGKPLPPPNITAKWHNVTARQALQAVLENYGWQMILNPATKLARITFKDPPADQVHRILPLISSGVAGPLGVLHLPRLWLKVSLECRGKLAAGYPDADKNYDQMVIEGLGLKLENVTSFIKDSRPTYTEFEKWVKNQPGVKLDKPAINALNASITGYMLSNETRKTILGDNGIPDDTNAPRNAIDLNNLEEWKQLHEAVLK